jgi:hypothetical protein
VFKHHSGATAPGQFRGSRGLEIKPRSRDPDEVARKRRLERMKNVGLMLFGNVLVFSHLTTVASFLANVSKSDQNHWLVATAFTFTTSWILFPVSLTFVFLAVDRLLAAHPDHPRIPGPKALITCVRFQAWSPALRFLERGFLRRRISQRLAFKRLEGNLGTLLPDALRDSPLGAGERGQSWAQAV